MLQQQPNSENTLYELPLSFSEASMGFLYTFYLNLDDKYLDKYKECVSLKVNEVIKTLKIIFKNPVELIKEWNCENKEQNEPKWNEDEPHAEEFKSFENFFSDSENIFIKHFRFGLGEISLSVPNFGKNSLSPGLHVKNLDLFLNIYPKAKEAILHFNLRFKHYCNCNDIILLRQYFMKGRHGIWISKPGDPDSFSSDSVTSFEPKDYVYLIQDNLGKKKIKTEITDLTKNIVKSSIIEIQELSSCMYTYECEKKCFWNSKPISWDSKPESIDCLKQNNLNSIFSSSVDIDDCAEHLIQKYPQQIYSLLVGDKGWKFVPRKIALSRVRERIWSTRGFFSVFALDGSVLLFNFKHTNRYQKYRNLQVKLDEYYNQETNQYYTINFKIPGAQHGPLFFLEIASIMKLYSDNILKSLTDIDKYYDFLKELGMKEQKKNLRGSILTRLNLEKKEIEKLQRDSLRKLCVLIITKFQD